MKNYSYFNGKIMPTGKVAVSMFDVGFLRGFGVFDYIKVYDGVPFLLSEHIARFKRSARALGLKVPATDTEIKATVQKLLVKSKASLAAIRIVLTGGPACGLSYDEKHETFVIAIEECKPMDSAYYTKGSTLITHEHARIFPEAKTLNYITAVKLQKERARKKAVEILYTSNGKILEATTSNFFIFKGNTLVTPRENILIGMTRNHVLKLARKAGFTIEERDIMLKELAEAGEAFITASNKEVLPIVAVDGNKIGSGKVGPQVQTLMNLFQHSVQEYVRKYTN